MKNWALLLLTVLSLSGFSQSVSVASKAPEIAQPTPKGDTLRLSSLNGYVVLLDFWASWCGPCRMKNPQVVALYKEFQDKKWEKGTKGFTIYSVSLDKNYDAWQQAIKQDGLIWANHVSDLRGWSSQPGAAYGIRSIPQTILLDEQGYIIAINPSHELIENFMSKRMAVKKPKT
jgi:thiol-disulfide isomerase/thioredoxin